MRRGRRKKRRKRKYAYFTLSLKMKSKTCYIFNRAVAKMVAWTVAKTVA